jgi:hypothetical protein
MMRTKREIADDFVETLTEALDHLVRGPARLTTVSPANGAEAELVLHQAQDLSGSAIGCAQEHSVCVYDDRVVVVQWSTGLTIAEFTRPIDAEKLGAAIYRTVPIDWACNEHVPEGEVYSLLSANFEGVAKVKDEIVFGRVRVKCPGDCVVLYLDGEPWTMRIADDETLVDLLTDLLSHIRHFLARPSETLSR